MRIEARFRRLRGSILLLGLPLLTSCTVRITPPDAVRQPVVVLLLDHGRHASLVLPGGPEGAIRYSYGDWRYYALNQTGFRRGAAALLWPTASAFGRRELPVPVELVGQGQAVRVWTEEILALQVEEARVDALRASLDSLFREGARERLHPSPAFDLDFVPHPERYSLARNSNGMVTRWLRELGVETRGWAILSRWHMVAPQR